ncbi:hypothetical protein C4D60_Mb06t04650 [Musa balbisiana]|uniref:Uncharacterized protein n=1 Tax=Musa balbisiana TaxID=52838 RepID=A0A4S8IN27_MUSBA|nr:hypothetical protein C4D60_Mb06t04650 [Musa balbisiana]
MVNHVLDEEIVEVVDEIQTVVVVACLPAAVVAEQRPWLLSTPELADPSLPLKQGYKNDEKGEKDRANKKERREGEMGRDYHPTKREEDEAELY